MNFLWLSLKLERNSGWCGQRVWHNTVPPYHYSYSHRHYSHQAASELHWCWRRYSVHNCK